MTMSYIKWVYDYDIKRFLSKKPFLNILFKWDRAICGRKRVAAIPKYSIHQGFCYLW